MKVIEKEAQECIDFFNKYKFVDLSHRLEEHMPSYPAHSKYYHNLWESYWHGDVAVADDEGVGASKRLREPAV